MAYVPLADQDSEQELHHPKSWVTEWVFSQDHKVIAIQYGGIAIGVGIVALVLSLLMRMQLGFPDTFDLIDPSQYYQSRHDHGCLYAYGSAVRGFRQLHDPIDGRRPRHGVPISEHVKCLDIFSVGSHFVS